MAGSLPASNVFPMSRRKYYTIAVQAGRGANIKGVEGDRATAYEGVAAYDTRYAPDDVDNLRQICSFRGINDALFAVSDPTVYVRLMQYAICESYPPTLGVIENERQSYVLIEKEVSEYFESSEKFDGDASLNLLWEEYGKDQRESALSDPGTVGPWLDEYKYYLASQSVSRHQKLQASIFMFVNFFAAWRTEKGDLAWLLMPLRTACEAVAAHGCYKDIDDAEEVCSYNEHSLCIDLMADCDAVAAERAINLFSWIYSGEAQRTQIETIKNLAKIQRATAVTTSSYYDKRDTLYQIRASANGIGNLSVKDTAAALKIITPKQTTGTSGNDDTSTILRLLEQHYVLIATAFENVTAVYRERQAHADKANDKKFGDVNTAVIFRVQRAVSRIDLDDGIQYTILPKATQITILKSLKLGDALHKEYASAYIRAEGYRGFTQKLVPVDMPSEGRRRFDRKLFVWQGETPREGIQPTTYDSSKFAREAVEFIGSLFAKICEDPSVERNHLEKETSAITKESLHVLIEGMIHATPGRTDAVVDALINYTRRTVSGMAYPERTGTIPAGYSVLYITRDTLVELAWALYPRFMVAGQDENDIFKPNPKVEQLFSALVQQKIAYLFRSPETEGMRTNIVTARLYKRALFASLVGGYYPFAISNKNRAGAFHTMAFKIRLHRSGTTRAIFELYKNLDIENDLGVTLGSAFELPTREGFYKTTTRKGNQSVDICAIERHIRYAIYTGAGTDAVDVDGLKSIDNVDAVWGTFAMPILHTDGFKAKAYAPRFTDLEKHVTKIRQDQLAKKEVVEPWGSMSQNPTWSGCDNLELLVQMLSCVSTEQNSLLNDAYDKIGDEMFRDFTHEEKEIMTRLTTVPETTLLVNRACTIGTLYSTVEAHFDDFDDHTLLRDEVGIVVPKTALDTVVNFREDDSTVKSASFSYTDAKGASVFFKAVEQEA